MTDCPGKRLLLQAYVDGELDAANVLALEVHLRGCTACAEELTRIEAVRAILEAADLHQPAPATLRSRIEAAIVAEIVSKAVPAAPVRARWPAGGVAGRSWVFGLMSGLALSAAALFALPTLTRTDTENQLIAAHVRSLSLASHLTDIATSNQHVVRPWFNGKIDFAPPVPELAEQGFPLVGGRLDYVDGHAVAAIVYRRRLHTINLFVQSVGTLSLPMGITTRHQGYSMVRWSNGGLEFWAVSDIDPGELELFHRRFDAQRSL